MKSKFYLLIFILGLTASITAQNNAIATNKSVEILKPFTKSQVLDKKLKNFPENNTVKLELLRQICKENIDVDNEKLSIYSQLMLKLAVQLKNTEGQADALNFLGIVEDIEGHYSKALDYYSQALALVKNDKNSKTIGSISNNVGLIQWKKGDLKAALSSFYAGLKNAEKNSNIKLQGSISSNIGLVFQDLKRYQDALSWQKKALAFRLRLDDDYGLASTFNNIANSYSYLKKSDSSFYYLNKAITLQKNNEDDYGLGITYQNLATEFKNLKKFTEAEQYYIKSKNLREKIEDSLGLSFSYMSLANNYKELKDYKKAVFYGERALSVAKDLKSDERIAENSKSLSDIYRRSGQLEKALNLQDQYLIFHEKTFSDEMNNKVSDLNVKYETEKRKKDLVTANLQIKESEIASRKKNIWLVVFGALIILGFAVFRNFRTRSKLRQKQFSLEKKLVEEQALTKIQEQRLEISRDLHDSLGAQLTFMSSVIDGLKMSQNKYEVLSKKINSLSGYTENSISELKNTLWVLNTEVIYLEDLKLKMLNFINKAQEAKEEINFSFHFDIESNVEIPSKKASNLFRVFQEIINNSMKHSAAKNITIRIVQNTDDLRFTISDDGIGFNLEEKKNTSYGLQNMESRIQQMNGKLKITTAPGKNTTYEIQINLEND